MTPIRWVITQIMLTMSICSVVKLVAPRAMLYNLMLKLYSIDLCFMRVFIIEVSDEDGVTLVRCPSRVTTASDLQAESASLNYEVEALSKVAQLAVLASEGEANLEEGC